MPIHPCSPNHNILPLPNTNNIYPCSPNHNILPLTNTNNNHPCTPNHTTPTLHTAITTPTPTTTSQPNYLDPEGACDVRGSGKAGGDCGSGSGGANDSKDLYSLLFSVGRNDAGEEEKRTPRKTTARRRKSLVAEARSRHLKVGSKTST